MIQAIPIVATPSQTLDITLNNQACRINIYQKDTFVFLDLYVDLSLIIGGVLCHDRTRIVRDSYLGFVGDLSWLDTQGVSDPTYANFGTQYLLFYFT